MVPPPPPPKTSNATITPETSGVNEMSPKQIEKVERQKRYEAAHLAKMKGKATIRESVGNSVILPIIDYYYAISSSHCIMFFVTSYY